LRKLFPTYFASITCYPENYGDKNLIQSNSELLAQIPPDQGSQTKTSRKDFRIQNRKPNLAMGKGILLSKRRESSQAFHTLPHDAGYALSRSHAQTAGGNSRTARKGLWKILGKQWIKRV
jgi:hypothetical protein